MVVRLLLAKYIAILVCLSLLIGCKNKENDNTNFLYLNFFLSGSSQGTMKEYLNVDLTSVRGLMRTTDISSVSSNLLRSTTTLDGDMYSMASDGAITQIQVWEERETTVTTTVRVQRLINLENYVFFLYSNRVPADICQLVVARKSDGKLFCMYNVDTEIFIPAFWFDGDLVRYGDTVQTDSTNNVYISAYTGTRGSVATVDDYTIGIYKLDLSNPQTPVKTLVLDATASLNAKRFIKYKMNPSGDIMLHISPDYYYDKASFHFLRANTQTLETIVETKTNSFFDLSPTNVFYSFRSEGWYKTVRKYDLSSSAYASSTFDYTDPVLGFYPHGHRSPDFNCNTAAFAYWMETSDFNGNNFLQLDFSANSGQVLQVPGMDRNDKFKQMGCADTSVFILFTNDAKNGDTLVKYQEDTGFIEIIGFGNYSIGDFSVDTEGKVTFVGKNVNTLQEVVAEIAVGGAVISVLNTGELPEVEQYVELNKD
ncbi:MAG: hypothetical protein AAF518_26875 [Spirochaetota bacterium]